MPIHASIHGTTQLSASADKCEGTSWVTVVFSDGANQRYEFTMYVPLGVGRIYAKAINDAREQVEREFPAPPPAEIERVGDDEIVF